MGVEFLLSDFEGELLLHNYIRIKDYCSQSLLTASRVHHLLKEIVLQCLKRRNPHFGVHCQHPLKQVQRTVRALHPRQTFEVPLSTLLHPQLQ